MKVKYDAEAGAATIYFVNERRARRVKHQLPVNFEAGGMILLDFDKAGILLRITVLRAREILPEEILNDSESFS